MPAAPAADLTADLTAELDRQVEALVAAGVPALAGCSDAAFRALLAPLRDVVPVRPAGDPPFVVGLPHGTVPPLALVERLRLGSREGFSSMTADELAGFRPTADARVPDTPYLVVGVDTGAGTRGVAPQDALPALLAEGRSPLTLEEGLLLALLHPQVLQARECFEMLGSRSSDRRVTGLWVMKGGAPRLGWCWLGAPHDWLGMAACRERVR